jgi:hypothetical protein
MSRCLLCSHTQHTSLKLLFTRPSISPPLCVFYQQSHPTSSTSKLRTLIKSEPNKSSRNCRSLTALMKQKLLNLSSYRPFGRSLWQAFTHCVPHVQHTVVHQRQPKDSEIDCISTLLMWDLSTALKQCVDEVNKGNGRDTRDEYNDGPC